MTEFVRRYDDRIHGVLSCFNRMLFRGYLPLMPGWQMAEFLHSLDLKFSTASEPRNRGSLVSTRSIRFC